MSSLCLSQGYQFEEDNPYLSNPDPLSEGVKRIEAGDIPGAVRLFESAVQKEPDNQLVRRPAASFLFFSVFSASYQFMSEQSNKYPYSSYYSQLYIYFN